MRLKTSLISYSMLSVMLLGTSAALGDDPVREAWQMDWAHTGANEDVGFDIEIDRDGNVVTLGWSRDDVTGLDAVILKHDRSGQLLWQQRFNSVNDGDEYLGELHIDSDNNIVIGGAIVDPVTGYDYGVVKYDPEGNLLWADQFDGPVSGLDYASSFDCLAIDSDDSIFITGYSEGTSGAYEFTTIKYDGGGTREWVDRFAAPFGGNAYGWSLELASDGSLYVGGDARNSNGNGDYTLVKYDTNGSILWWTQFDGVYGLSDSLYDLALDDDDNPVLTGISDTAGGHEFGVAKFDANGTFLWEARYGGTAGYHYGWQIDVDSNGNVVVAGSTMTGGGEYDLAVVCFSTNGVLNWSDTYRTVYYGEDWANDVLIDNDENIVVTGYSWNWLISGFDVITLKYDSAGNELWEIVHDGPAHGTDLGYSLAVDESSNVYVTGAHLGAGTGSDLFILKYTELDPPALSINPDPLVAGSFATFSVSNFEPFTDTYLYYTLRGPGETYVESLNVTLGIKRPKQAGGVVQTDANGSVDWLLFVPNAAAGSNVWLQAAQYNQVTNVVETTVL